MIFALHAASETASASVTTKPSPLEGAPGPRGAQLADFFSCCSSSSCDSGLVVLLLTAQRRNNNDCMSPCRDEADWTLKCPSVLPTLLCCVKLWLIIYSVAWCHVSLIQKYTKHQRGFYHAGLSAQSQLFRTQEHYDNKELKRSLITVCGSMYETGVRNMIKYRFVLRRGELCREGLVLVKERGHLESAAPEAAARPQTSAPVRWLDLKEPNRETKTQETSLSTWVYSLSAPRTPPQETKDKTARVKTTSLIAVWTHFLFVTPASVDWRAGMSFSVTEWWQTVKQSHETKTMFICSHVVESEFPKFYWCRTQIRLQVTRIWFCGNGLRLMLIWKPPGDFTPRQVDETAAATSWGEAASSEFTAQTVDPLHAPVKVQLSRNPLQPKQSCVWWWGNSMLMSDRIHDFFYLAAW